MLFFFPLLDVKVFRFHKYFILRLLLGLRIEGEPSLSIILAAWRIRIRLRQPTIHREYIANNISSRDATKRVRYTDEFDPLPRLQDQTIKHYLKKGASQEKLILGIPTYGRSYTLLNPESTEIESPAEGPGKKGEATKEKGYLAYYEVALSAFCFSKIPPLAERFTQFSFVSDLFECNERKLDNRSTQKRCHGTIRVSRRSVGRLRRY